MPANKSGEKTPLGPYFRDANGSVHLVPDISPLGEHIADATKVVGTYSSNTDGKTTRLFTGTTDPLSYHPDAPQQPTTPTFSSFADISLDTLRNAVFTQYPEPTEAPRAKNFKPSNREAVKEAELLLAHASVAFVEFDTDRYELSQSLRQLENVESRFIQAIAADPAMLHRAQDALGLNDSEQIMQVLDDLSIDTTIYGVGYDLLTTILDNVDSFTANPSDVQTPQTSRSLAEQHQQIMTKIRPLFRQAGEMVETDTWPESLSLEGRQNITAIVEYLQGFYETAPADAVERTFEDMDFTHDRELNILEGLFPEIVLKISERSMDADLVVNNLSDERIEEVLRENQNVLGILRLPESTEYLDIEDANRVILRFKLAEGGADLDALFDNLADEIRVNREAAKDEPFHPMYLKSEVLGSVRRDLVKRAIYDAKYGTSDTVEGLAKILDMDTTSLDLDALRDQTEQYLTNIRDEDITDSDVFYSVVNTIISNAEALGITLDTSSTISNNTTIVQQLRQLALELRPLFGRVSDIITSTNPQWPNGTTQEAILSAIQEMTDSLTEQEPGLEIKPAQILWRVYNALKPQNPSLIDYLQAHDAKFVNEELANLSTSFGLTFENNTATDTLTETTQGGQTSTETSSSLIDLHSAKLEDLETTIAILRSYNNNPTIQNAEIWKLAETINPARVPEHSDDSIHATAYINRARALVEKELRQKRLEQAIDSADGEERLGQVTNAIITTLQLNEDSRNDRRLGQALAIWATLENMPVNSSLEVEQLIERANQTTTAILDGNDFEDMRFLAEALYVREGYVMPQSWRDSASNSRARVRQTLQQGILNLKSDVAEVLKRPSTQIQEPSNLNSFQDVNERSAYLKQQGYTITVAPTQDKSVSQITARREDDGNIEVHSFYTTEPGADNVEHEQGRQETSRLQPSGEILPSLQADEVGQRRRASFGDKFAGKPDVTTTW